MKKLIAVACLLALPLIGPGDSFAQERSLTAMRMELEALTESLAAQAKLLEIYEDLGKKEEARTTRLRILELVASQRKLLDEIAKRLGEKPAVRVPVRGVLPRSRPPRSRPLLPRKTDRLPANTEVSESVDLALEWLAAHQDQDGFWDSDGFMARDEAEPKSDGPGSPLYDPGVTGLALLAFLGAGETHKSGDYKKTVASGFRYLKHIQDPEGCYGPRTTNHFIYNHAICTLAMVEVYALTASPLFKQSAQLGVDFLHKAQNPYLAWRYGVRPQDNDTSVTGWAVAALASAKRAGLRVDATAFEGARAWIEKVTEPEYGRVGYTARGSGPARPQDLMDQFPADKSESLTAAGIMIRMHCGEDPRTSEQIQKGVDLMLKVPPIWDETAGAIDMYYWLWGTFASDRIGGRVWRDWSRAVQRAVVGNQRADGNFRGSWDPIGVWGREGGRVYSTALMAMVLETVGRHEKSIGTGGGK